MKDIKGRLVSFLTACLLGIIVCSETVYAFQPNKAYLYNNNEEAVPAVNAYQIKTIIDGKQDGFGDLLTPQDIFVDSQDNIYILDSGNFRVVILDKHFDFVKDLSEFTYQGEVINLGKNASGIFFREDTQMLYITDTSNDRILVSDIQGKIDRIYVKPETQLIDEKIAFKPKKIIVDNMGIMYVTSGSINTGALMIDVNNNFLGFYGTNKITETLAVKMEYMMRSILTEEQQSVLVENFQPTEFNNLFWSEDRFIYVVSPISEKLATSVAKLNVVGENVLTEDTFFGDLTTSGESEASATVDASIEANVTTGMASVAFVDITVDEEGFFTVIDTVSGKLYQYDENCNLISVYGGRGYQKGLFQKPVAIETNSDKQLLILDSTKRNISVLELTYYGEMVRNAVELHGRGLYKDALECWNEVLLMNPNFALGYVGVGKAYMDMGEYEQAMNYFELGGDQENYGLAKSKLRSEWIRDHFMLLAVSVVCLIMVIMCWDWIKKVVFNVRKTFAGRKGRING